MDSQETLGCAMVCAPFDINEQIAAWAKSSINPLDLSAKGLEEELHITLKYGFDETKEAAPATAIRLQMMLMTQKEFQVSLGKIGVFDHHPDYDVVYIEAISPMLVMLNSVISQTFEVQQSLFSYKPHMTLAYVNKGKGSQFLNNPVFTGTRFSIREVIYSSSARYPYVLKVGDLQAYSETEKLKLQESLKIIDSGAFLSINKAVSVAGHNPPSPIGGASTPKSANGSATPAAPAILSNFHYEPGGSQRDPMARRHRVSGHRVEDPHTPRGGSASLKESHKRLSEISGPDMNTPSGKSAIEQIGKEVFEEFKPQLDHFIPKFLRGSATYEPLKGSVGFKIHASNDDGVFSATARNLGTNDAEIHVIMMASTGGFKSSRTGKVEHNQERLTGERALSRDYLHQALDSAANMGIKKVSFESGLSDGGKIWAKMGADFPDDQRARMSSNFKNQVAYILDGGKGKIRPGHRPSAESSSLIEGLKINSLSDVKNIEQSPVFAELMSNKKYGRRIRNYLMAAIDGYDGVHSPPKNVGEAILTHHSYPGEILLDNLPGVIRRIKGESIEKSLGDYLNNISSKGLGRGLITKIGKHFAQVGYNPPVPNEKGQIHYETQNGHRKRVRGQRGLEEHTPHTSPGETSSDLHAHHVPPYVDKALESARQALGQGRRQAFRSRAAKFAYFAQKRIPTPSETREIISHAFGERSLSHLKNIQNRILQRWGSATRSVAPRFDDLKVSQGTGDNPVLKSVARRYISDHAHHGLPDKFEDHVPYYRVDQNVAKKLADAYDSLPHEPKNEKIKASYDQMKVELIDQFNALRRSGYEFTAWNKEGQPYQTSTEMCADVRENKHIYFFPTDQGFGEEGKEVQDNPLLDDTGIKLDGKSLCYNDVLRAVHDVFGHAVRGYQFGPRGEENAWREHARMFSPRCLLALTNETRAQNSWVNSGKHLRNENGDIPAKGEEGYVPPPQRPYAPQKCVLLPEKFCDPHLVTEGQSPAGGDERKGDKPVEAKTGKDFAHFFSDVASGKRDKSDIPFEPTVAMDPESKKVSDTLEKFGGNFFEHIRKSIPTYHEAQTAKCVALLKSLPAGSTFIDIGGSEGTRAKTLSSLSGGKIHSTILDPNPEMADHFRKKDPVENSHYEEKAFRHGWTEDDGKVIEAHEPKEKYDAVNESMVFQFISPDRDGQVKEIADKYLKPDGIFITDQKLWPDKDKQNGEEWKENEKVKDTNHKKKYFDDETLAAKQKTVGFADSSGDSKSPSMVGNMVERGDYEKTLKKHFQHVAQYWKAGNFAGYVASNDEGKLKNFLDNMPAHNDSKYSDLPQQGYKKV